jgi:hypothetical protein
MQPGLLDVDKALLVPVARTPQRINERFQVLLHPVHTLLGAVHPLFRLGLRLRHLIDHPRSVENKLPDRRDFPVVPVRALF